MRYVFSTFFVLVLAAAVDGQSLFLKIDQYDLERRILEREGGEIADFYRKPTPAELAVLEVDPFDAKDYEKFLALPDTGIVRLAADNGCDQLTAKPKPNMELCRKYTMPGSGSGFSFRTRSHRLWTLSDLLFDGASSYSLGMLSQGFVAKLGEEPIGKLSLNSPGVSFAAAFVPATDRKSAIKQNEQFTAGVRQDGFHYAKSVPMRMGATYVIRSVAYQGVVKRRYRRTDYNELDHDTRTDIIAVFRVIRGHDEGSVTLLWRVLREAASARLD